MRRPLPALAVALVVLGAASCSRGPSDEVAVTVNGEPITVHKVRAERDARPGHHTARAIESLIDRQLLVQRALEQGLDRKPAVAAAIASARERVLVQAYVESLAHRDYQHDPDAIHDFYEERPALFAQRRVYRLLEVRAGGTAEQLEQVKAFAQNATSLYAVAEWLGQRRLPFSVGTAIKAAEQIPLALLPTLSAMRDGEIKVLPVQDGISVVQIIQSELQPVGEEDAAGRIRQHLWLRAGSEAVAEELKWLRSKAQVDYRLDGTHDRRGADPGSIAELIAP